METSSERLYKNFGPNLKRARKDKKLSRAALGELTNVAPRTLASWENQELSKKKKFALPTDLDILLSISEVLECDLDYLFGKIDTKHHKTTDVCMATGLTPKTVETLAFLNNLSRKNSKIIIGALMDFIEEIITSIPASISHHYMQLKSIREVEVYEDGYPKDVAFREVAGENIERYLTIDESKRFFISEISMDIETILRKDD